MCSVQVWQENWFDGKQWLIQRFVNNIKAFNILYIQVRIVDCFLFEGQKVLFRVSLSLLSEWCKTRKGSFKGDGTALAVAQDIAHFCRTYSQPCNRLLKVGCGIIPQDVYNSFRLWSGGGDILKREASPNERSVKWSRILYSKYSIHSLQV